ncbi:Mfa1 family fimbria major subunit [Segatella copri]|uniref:Mfa1 family fimbria major subunit n=1 Tax=Segatella copri TaxID=165179 RepID=UPI0022E96A7A|nr:Mfa1 family fimbria major subunit [Segatella copri]
MRIKHFFGLAVIAAMTASCSSNNDLVNGGNGSSENETGVSYASITINLPTTSGTRAVNGSKNDQFDEGTPSEYAVNDATLVIFEKAGASENDYTYVEAVSLGNLEPWKKDNESTNGITTEATITAELKSAKVVQNDDKYYALVILNNEVGKDKKVALPSNSITYGAWNVASNATAKNLVNNKDGFYMANAPRFTEVDVEPTTLVPIKGIYRTKEEAHSKPATTVHVERGLAKVTVGPNSTGKNNYFTKDGANATGSNYSSDKVEITKWALDVTNNYSFPVHVTSGLKDGSKSTDQTVPAYADIWKNEAATAGTTVPATNRFVSQLPAKDAFKRVYWGIDPNYSKNLTAKDACGQEFTLVKANGSDATWKSSKDPLYCLENTFDIYHMMQGQTTRVLLKAIYTPSAVAKETDKTFFMIGNSSDIWTTKTLKDQIASKAKEALSLTTAPTVELKEDLLKGGTHFLTTENVSIKDGETEKINTPDLVATLNNKLGLDETKGVGIKTYKNGESYYIARIKHFGDDLTPWGAGNDNYGGKNLEWLGRYGVLRNNWYDLAINSISGPGYPDVPEVKPTDPDDEDTKYINVEVKILDWAKRSQNVDL